MKFVNKLTVISSMISVMNVANSGNAAPAIAAACKGTKVSWCNEIKDKSQCANHFMVDGGKGLTCAWNTYCTDNGGACNPLLPKENNNTPPPKVTNQFK